MVIRLTFAHLYTPSLCCRAMVSSQRFMVSFDGSQIFLVVPSNAAARDGHPDDSLSLAGSSRPRQSRPRCVSPALLFGTRRAPCCPASAACRGALPVDVTPRPRGRPARRRPSSLSIRRRMTPMGMRTRLALLLLVLCGRAFSPSAPALRGLWRRASRCSPHRAHRQSAPTPAASVRRVAVVVLTSCSGGLPSSHRRSCQLMNHTLPPC